MRYLKGSRFEGYVLQQLRCMPFGKAIVPKSLYSRELKKRTQIDALFLTSYKIYCIEIKSAESLSGDIDSSTWWSSSSANSSKKAVIYNPYMQNMFHILALKNFLYKKDIFPVEIDNIIIVSDRVHLTTNCSNFYTVNSFMDKLCTDHLLLKEQKCLDVVALSDMLRWRYRNE